MRWRIARAVLLFLLGPPLIGLVAFRWLPVPVTPLMLVRLVEGEGLQQDWVPLEAMPPALVRSVIASEDARFCVHNGFDWREIANAWQEWRRGEGLRGASTISMQTARSVFLWPGRDIVRKGLEAVLTPPLELLWPKPRILEVYLNVAEWGPGIYGAGAAARYHFNRPVETLGPVEAARLTAILPAPRSWSAGTPGAYVRGRAATIQARAAAVSLGDGNRPCGAP
ncbi:monofunctional biosynthetic peptidoglycan transglycosylase [Roseospira marina]|uniref:Biosynthetic peptidoglycan transglycosylase n=1 Tax=Roseospira marina TaxID=140057 RepID=A0A5M6ICQ6_9PROT|nr:monofunctional biosynthetic peptidoglycan transglycosylase [Roseospira marina]KAA5605525.1 monofunctional biosynthetic peptidoglycan transglycosylase [Roseospira marina]